MLGKSNHSLIEEFSVTGSVLVITSIRQLILPVTLSQLVSVISIVQMNHRILNIRVRVRIGLQVTMFQCASDHCAMSKMISLSGVGKKDFGLESSSVGLKILLSSLPGVCPIYSSFSRGQYKQFTGQKLIFHLFYNRFR